MTIPPAILLRPAGRSDAADLLAWRNDPVTRRNSRNTGAVEPAGHAAWLERALADANRRLWIAERGGETLGTVSATLGGDGAVELSLTVAPAMRGRGAGAGMIRAALVEVAAAWPGAVVRATVRAENAASRRLFERCGFVATGEGGGFLAYRYTG